MRLTLSAIMISSLFMAACGGDDGDTVTPSIDAARIDGSGGTDAPPAACTVSTTNFADRGPIMGGTYLFRPGANAAATDDELDVLSQLEAAQPTDLLRIQLYAGYGAFAGRAIVPGTYQITGDELDFATCGVCVMLATNVTAMAYDDDYMATSGTVTITAAGTAVGGMLAGSLSNIQFHHVMIDPQTGATTQAADTCTSAMSNATFSGTLAAPMMKMMGPAPAPRFAKRR